MRRPLAQNRALRALFEGARPTLDLLAASACRSLPRLRLQAEREGWKLASEPEDDFCERLLAVRAQLLDYCEAISREVAEGGKIDRKDIDQILALIRAIEKLGEFQQPPEEAAKEKQIKRDEALADVLDRINGKIIELAEEFARQMVAERDRAAGRGAA